MSRRFNLSAEMVRIAGRFRAVRGVVSNLAEEYDLHVQPMDKGAVVVGTDGAAMAVCYDPDAIAPCAAGLHLSSAQYAQLGGRQIRDRRLIVDNDTTTLMDSTLGSIFEVDGSCMTTEGHRYPDWRGAIPEVNDAWTRTVPTAMRVKYLRTIASLYEGEEDLRQVNFYGTKVGHPIIAVFPFQPNVFMVIMPVVLSPDALAFKNKMRPPWLFKD